MRYLAWLMAAILVAGLATGCSSSGNTDLDRLTANVDAFMRGWAREDITLMSRFVSNDYAFDEQNAADHLAAIAADFPDIRNLRVVSRHAQVINPNLASVQVEFTDELLADISAVGEPVASFAFVPSDNILDQVWIKDFDGVWRLAAEYLQHSWVLANTPTISALSISPGDLIAPGDTGAFSATAVAANSSQRITLAPSCDAAVVGTGFNPISVFGFGATTYNGAVTIRADALGEYSFALIGQTDIPGQQQMLGRTLLAVFIDVSTRKGRAIIGGKTVPGNRQSVFRRVGIRRAAGLSKRLLSGAPR